jgi:carbamoyltransferase
VDGRVYFPHSLGAFYTAITQFLGFPHYGDEYKVMGLAPYGEPTHMNEMRRIVPLAADGTYRLDLQYFRHARERLPHQWSSGTPVVGAHWSAAMEQLLGPARRPDQPLEQRHKDIARSAQVMFEEAFFHLLNTLHRRYGLDDLAIAGGCGMNSVANGKVTVKTPFRRIYVQSAAGDAGGAIGAALSLWHRQGGARCQPMNHAYLGPHASQDEIDALVVARAADLEAAGCSIRRIDDEAALCVETASAIADGLVMAGSKGGWSGAPGPSATDRSWATRVART